MPQPSCSVLSSSSGLPEGLAGSQAAFPAAEFAGRIAGIRAALKPTGADALLLTGPENIFWATGRQTAGYFAFQALVVPLTGEPVLLVRQLETTGARASTWLADIRAWQDGEDPAAVLAALIDEMRIGHLAIERNGWFVSLALSERIVAALSHVRLPMAPGWSRVCGRSSRPPNWRRYGRLLLMLRPGWSPPSRPAARGPAKTT